LRLIVTGGASGLGKAVALGAAARGAKVAVIDRDGDKARATSAEIGGLALTADVRREAEIVAALDEIDEAHGTASIVVNCAGIGTAGRIVGREGPLPLDAFARVIDVNLIGTFNVMRAAHQHLRKPGAAVLNISAPQAANPTRLQAHVCAAKAGVDMLTRVLALEWGVDGIRVNSLIPGPISGTEGIRRLAAGSGEAEWSKTVALGRFGTREEVAQMAMVLCSPLASYVTGALVPVDGGASLHGGRDLSAALTVPR